MPTTSKSILQGLPDVDPLLLAALDREHRRNRSDVAALELRVVTTTADYAATDKRVILADGTSNTVDVTLPDAARCKGRLYYIKALDITNAVKILTTGADTIDGADDYTFGAQYDAERLISDGANWHKL